MDSTETRIYIDESCHLSTNDGFMVLGAVWGSPESLSILAQNVKLLKQRYNIPVRREIKWTKVAPKMIGYYKELLDIFLESDGVNYRGVIIDKSYIDNKKYMQTDDDFYYKMLYLVVRNIAEKRRSKIRIFLDYKDTFANSRSQKLAEVLHGTVSLSERSFDAQPIRSFESTPLQIADLINGAVMYSKKSEAERGSTAKTMLVEYLKEKTKSTLADDTPRHESKFNLLFWRSNTSS